MIGEKKYRQSEIQWKETQEFFFAQEDSVSLNKVYTQMYKHL